MQLLRTIDPTPHVVHQHTAIAFLRHPVSAKVGKISSNGIVIAEEARQAAPADEAMITSTVCEIVWFAGLVAWYIIRYPFERRAKKVGVTKSLFGWRELGLLSLAFFGLWIVPAIYALTGFPSCSRSSAYSDDCDSRRRRVCAAPCCCSTAAMRTLAEIGQSHWRFATNIGSSRPAFIGSFGIRCIRRFSC